MSVRVVQGLVGRQQADQIQAPERAPSAPQAPSAASQALAQQQTQASSLARAVQQSVANNEAVVTTLRSVRPGGTSEGADKIRSDREAKQVAEEVADKIRDDGKGEALDAHSGLNKVGAGSSLVSQ